MQDKTLSSEKKTALFFSSFKFNKRQQLQWPSVHMNEMIIWFLFWIPPTVAEKGCSLRAPRVRAWHRCFDEMWMFRLCSSLSPARDVWRDVSWGVCSVCEWTLKVVLPPKHDGLASFFFLLLFTSSRVQLCPKSHTSVSRLKHNSTLQCSALTVCGALISTSTSSVLFFFIKAGCKQTVKSTFYHTEIRRAPQHRWLI